MVKYECPKCKKTFTHKGHYTAHIDRKFDCVKKDKRVETNISDNVISSEIRTKNQTEKQETSTGNQKSVSNTTVQNIDPFICEYCGTKFSRRDSKNRHIKLNCTHVKESKKEPEKDTSVNKEVNKNIENQQIGQQFNVNAETVNINNAAPLVNAFGREEKGYITQQMYTELFEKGKNSILEYIKQVHFNIQHPENHNVFLKSVTGDYVLIYDGNGWKVKIKGKIVDELYNDSYSDLDDVYHKRINAHPDRAVIMFEKFLEINGKNAKNEKSEKSDKKLDSLFREIKKEIGYALFDERVIVDEYNKNYAKKTKK